MALNSLLRSSAWAFSVMFRKRRHDPSSFSPSMIGEMTSEYSCPFLEYLCSLLIPPWALFIALMNESSRSSVRMLLPMASSPTPKSLFAALFIEIIDSSALMRMNASLMLPVISANSLRLASSSRMRKAISFCCPSIFTSRGESSS